MTSGQMRSVRQTIDEGVETLSQLRESLQTALALEFATIPPYLCAQWSIRKDPDRVEGLIHGVVSQEMKHIALVGNVLSSNGGRPRLCAASFYPRFPLSELPGGIALKRPVTLSPLTFEQLRVFLDIERPEYGEPPANGSIGMFYEKMVKAIEVLNPDISADRQIPIPLVPPIRNPADAIACLRRVIQEGEGSPLSPEEAPGDELRFAHYYTFKEIYLQRRLVRSGGSWDFVGDKIAFPDVYDFAREPSMSPRSHRFATQLKRLLLSLEEGWSKARAFNVAEMFALEVQGRKLIAKGVRPAFEWVEET